MRFQLLMMFVGFSALAVSAELPRSTPEEQGVSSPQLFAFVEAVDAIDTMNSFMLVRHGHVVAEGWWEPYRRDARHSLYSLSKSFTSTAVGLAIAEGRLRLDDPVLKFFPEDSPDNNLKAMRVSDLLRMSTGHQTEPPRTDSEPWTRTFLAQPVPFKPGTHFLYNTSATYMQSAIVQQVTGQTLLDYLRPRLFEPLGIDDPTWETSPQGISTGGFGLSVRTEDIAKFGQLYLQRGQWNGQQLVPAEWIDAATSLQTSNGSNPESDWDQGYGYQFWRCRHGAYRGDGAFGQYCVVLPEQDAVIVITSGVKDMQQVLNLVWGHLLPALRPEPLPASATDQLALRSKLEGLSVRRPPGADPRPGVAGRRYQFPENEMQLQSLELQPGSADGDEVLVLRTADGQQRIECGGGRWIDGRVRWGNRPDQPAAVAGGWSGETFTVKICFYETPFIVTATLKFADDQVTFNSEANVGFGPTKQSELVGQP